MFWVLPAAWALIASAAVRETLGGKSRTLSPFLLIRCLVRPSIFNTDVTRLNVLSIKLSCWGAGAGAESPGEKWLPITAAFLATTLQCRTRVWVRWGSLTRGKAGYGPFLSKQCHPRAWGKLSHHHDVGAAAISWLLCHVQWHGGLEVGNC